MLLAGAIFVLTLVLVIWQPRGLGIGWSAAFGAALALVTGGVQIADIPVVAYRLECHRHVYRRDHYQPAARRVRLF